MIVPRACLAGLQTNSRGGHEADICIGIDYLDVFTDIVWRWQHWRRQFHTRSHAFIYADCDTDQHVADWAAQFAKFYERCGHRNSQRADKRYGGYDQWGAIDAVCQLRCDVKGLHDQRCRAFANFCAGRHQRKQEQQFRRDGLYQDLGLDDGFADSHQRGNFGSADI